MTLGTILINSLLPVKHQLKAGQVLDKTALKKLMVEIAREDGAMYADVVIRLKRMGDLFGTLEPSSPGLNDLGGSNKDIDAMLDELDKQVRKEGSYDKKIALLSKGQEAAVQKSLSMNSNFTKHVKSGGRGNPVQLSKMIVSPVASGGSARGITPMVIKRSYSTGLSSGEYFASTMEARQNAVDTFLQVQKPGTVNKTLTSNLNSLLITETDCGTKNGIFLDVSDPHVLDRYTTDKNLVDEIYLRKMTSKNIEKVKVRTPMTCSTRDGICSYCYGLLENKALGEVGTNIGVRSAQAMSEPLIQMTLDTKHSSKLTSASDKGLRGLAGVDQLMKVPKNFLNKAIVAKVTGKVTEIKDAPQGGTFVFINNKEHYVEPGFKVLTKEGDDVEAGDILSEGIPNPAEIVEYKGLGAGRKHYVDAMHQVYKTGGTNIDKRHIENLARQTLNYVRMNHSDTENNLFAGEIQNYNKVRDILRKSGKEVSVDEAIGKYLADEYIHHTAGTLVSPSIAKEIKAAGIKSVSITAKDALFVPIMRSAEMTPLMNPDMLAKMGFTKIKENFQKGLHTGAKSDLHGTSPWPGYMYGKEFGKGERGHY